MLQNLTETPTSLVALAVVCLLMVCLVYRRQLHDIWDKLSHDEPRYAGRPALLTAAERRFYEVLRAALEADGLAQQAVVCCQVRLADLVEVAGEKTGSPSWWRAYRRVSQKHVDFVLCDRESFAIRCVIELQDRSHVTDRRRRARDEEVRGVLGQAGIPLLEIPVQARYDQIDLMLALRRILDSQGTGKASATAR